MPRSGKLLARVHKCRIRPARLIGKAKTLKFESDRCHALPIAVETIGPYSPLNQIVIPFWLEFRTISFLLQLSTSSLIQGVPVSIQSSEVQAPQHTLRRYRRKVLVSVGIPPRLLAAVDDWGLNHGLASRTETIRQLIALGLKHSTQSSPPSDQRGNSARIE